MAFCTRQAQCLCATAVRHRATFPRRRRQRPCHSATWLSPPFTGFHWLSLPFPFTAFHCLSLPFTAFRRSTAGSIAEFDLCERCIAAAIPTLHVVLLHPPLTCAGFSTGMERGCQDFKK